MARNLNLPIPPQHAAQSNALRMSGELSAMSRMARDLDHAEALIAALEVAANKAMDRADAAEARAAELEKATPTPKAKPAKSAAK